MIRDMIVHYERKYLNNSIITLFRLRVTTLNRPTKPHNLALLHVGFGE